MPIKPMSTMTDTEFTQYRAALGLNRKQLAEALGIRGPTVTGYQSGKPIPVWVAEKLLDLLQHERQRIMNKARTAGETLIAMESDIGAMLVLQNQSRFARPGNHNNLARFARRQKKPDTRVLPVYRMTRERFVTYIEALSRWQAHVRELARTYTDEARQRDYSLEIHDIRSMADTAPRALPYDVLIERSQWDVVSRALRHLATDPAHYAAAHALRTHWGKHRFSGYLARRRYPKFKPTEGATT